MPARAVPSLTEKASVPISGPGLGRAELHRRCHLPLARGVGWLLSESGVPRRIKSAFLTDADIADLTAYAASLCGQRSAA